jgi:cell division initiation protein
MRLTPLDIKKQEFRRTMRGYDPAEVESFLEMVAASYEELLTDLNNYRTETEVKQRELDKTQEVENTLRSTLNNLQQTSQQNLANSEKEAALIIREAEVKAAELIDKARNKVDRVREDTRLLQAQKESLVRRLRHLLKSQLELISMLEKDDVSPTQKNKPKVTAAKSTSEPVKRISKNGIVAQKDGRPTQDVQADIERMLRDLPKRDS